MSTRCPRRQQTSGPACLWKTSLLDAFRGSSIAAGEAGGITQAISAFTVPPARGRSTAITFIDTPGHELFNRMRERGAHATDIILLICALDAGVQGTTREAIRYAREVGCPMIVAANKVDKPGAAAALPKLSQQLLEAEVMLEQFGGEVPIVPVSATKRLHLDEVLDAIHLQAEVMELHAQVSQRECHARGKVRCENIERGSHSPAG
jgi:translation initiation factor IF-2